jgi:hypothetical protein
MENTAKIPVLQKVTTDKHEVLETSSCCTPKYTNEVCCEPSKSKATTVCCAQPEDGSACCTK